MREYMELQRELFLTEAEAKAVVEIVKYANEVEWYGLRDRLYQEGHDPRVVMSGIQKLAGRAGQDDPLEDTCYNRTS